MATGVAGRPQRYVTGTNVLRRAGILVGDLMRD